MQFSGRNRAQFKAALRIEFFDLLVIGGGITGAGIALDAASRGLKVALVEKLDFGSGTSSRSTKLIHGGLRYLKQFEIGLVREVGQERAILHRNAPHIVIPEKMLLPIIEGGSLGKYSTSLGLFVYDRLAGVLPDERRKMLNKKETLELEPLLREDILLGGGIYIEYRTDDSRLVIEVLKSAVQMGATALNYCDADSFIYDNGRISGLVCRDRIAGDTLEIKAKKIINACGPWVDTLRKKDNSLHGKRLHLTKGVHLVISRDRLPLRQAVYFDIPKDGRMMFAIPRGEIIYLGTTDTSYTDQIDNPMASDDDVNYILSATNFMFPEARLSRAEVISTWAGLRPLIHEDGKSPSELSRKDEIFVSPSGLYSMAGGKLTGFRKMAERVVDMVVADISKTEGRSFKRCYTDTIILSGGETGDPTKYALSIGVEYPSVDNADINELVFKFGSNAPQILDIHLSEKIDLLDAQWKYCVDNEMVQCIADLVIRRLGMLYFDRPEIAATYRELHEKISAYIGLDGELSATLLKDFEKEYKAVMAFEADKPIMQ